VAMSGAMSGSGVGRWLARLARRIDAFGVVWRAAPFGARFNALLGAAPGLDPRSPPRLRGSLLKSARLVDRRWHVVVEHF
jgi:hypothetical protein